MMISVQDFVNWKQDPVTKAFFEAANQRIEDAKDLLASSAGIDSTTDRFLVGMIQAYRELQEFRIDDLGGVE